MNIINGKYYELYKPKAKELIVKVLKFFKFYEVYHENNEIVTTKYYDTEQNLLGKVDILVSKTSVKKSAKLKLERNLEDNPRSEYIKKVEQTECEMEIAPNDMPQKHFRFLGDNFPRLIQQPFTFDVYKLFDDLRETLIIESKNENYKVIGGNGSTFRVVFEDVEFYNTLTERHNFISYLHIFQDADKVNQEEFDKFVARLESYCKFIFEINESKFKQGTRLTRKLENENKQVKQKTNKKQKSDSEFDNLKKILK